LPRPAWIDTDGAEENGVVGGQFLESRGGKGLAGFEVVLPAEGIVRGGIGEGEPSAEFFQDSESGGDDFFPDAVAGHDRDIHGRLLERLKVQTIAGIEEK
jgi:hypothetical protein